MDNMIKSRENTRSFKPYLKSSNLKPRIRLLSFRKSVRDKIPFYRKRTMKYEHWVEKYKNVRRAFDYRLLSFQKLEFNLMIIKLGLAVQVNSLIPISRESKSYWDKITPWMIRLETPKKTWDSLQVKLANFRTNLRLFVEKTMSLEREWLIIRLLRKE